MRLFISLSTNLREKLLEQIDEALDTRDEATFHKLVRILQQMDNDTE